MTAIEATVGHEVVDLRSLATEIRRCLGPVAEMPDWPLVSIIVLNRNGDGYLRRMIMGLTEHTDYPRLELIVVDNDSNDDSLAFLRRVETPFPILILGNQHNESFSDGCNQGVAVASGELLLFLNNDTEPFERGWLRELVTSLRESEAAAAAATLICRDEEHEESFRHGYGVQHRGLTFREEAQMIHPVLHGWEADPLDESLGVDAERGAVAAACLLVERKTYEHVGGFSHGYVYGAEDVDLCLKLRRAGLGVICSGRSIAIHHPVSTRRTAPFEEERARKLGNRRLLWERWGPQLRREYELDRLDEGGLWAQGGSADGGGEEAEPAGRPLARAEIEALGFCLKVADPGPPADPDAVLSALRRRGHRCLLLEGDRVEDPTGLNYDVAVHLRGSIRYVPKPAQLNVLWSVNRADEPSPIECSHYDLVLTDAEDPDPFVARLLAAVEARIPEVGYCRRVKD